MQIGYIDSARAIHSLRRKVIPLRIPRSFPLMEIGVDVDDRLTLVMKGQLSGTMIAVDEQPRLIIGSDLAHKWFELLPKVGPPHQAQLALDQARAQRPAEIFQCAGRNDRCAEQEQARGQERRAV